LQPGARVRLTLPCDPGLPSPPEACPVEGRVVTTRGDTITLASGESTSRHSLGSARRIEVSRGRRSHWLVGAGAGFVLGAGSTFLLLNQGGSTNPCDRSANQDAIGPGACAGLATLGGVAGAGVGAVIGGLFRTERWQDVPVQTLRVSLGPRPGVRFHAAVSLAF